jgi:hypothetical protein
MTTTAVPSISACLRSYVPPAPCWAAWQTIEHGLAGVSYAALRLHLLDRSCPPERKDAWLCALVRLAKADSDAALCVTACLYPGLCGIVRRYSDVLGVGDTWGELLASLARRVTRYDVEHRPQHVAANLLWDARHDLSRCARRELAWHRRVELTTDFAAEQHDVGTPDVLEAAASAGTLKSVDATLIRSTRLDGLPLHDVAHLLGISYEAAKKRRQRAEAAWFAWWRPDLVERAA